MVSRILLKQRLISVTRSLLFCICGSTTNTHARSHTHIHLNWINTFLYQMQIKRMEFVYLNHSKCHAFNHIPISMEIIETIFIWKLKHLPNTRNIVTWSDLWLTINAPHILHSYERNTFFFLKNLFCDWYQPIDIKSKNWNSLNYQSTYDSNSYEWNLNRNS